MTRSQILKKLKISNKYKFSDIKFLLYLPHALP